MMPDAAEGLVDAQARIQERMEEREELKKRARRAVKDPDRARALESLRLAHTELERQLELTTNAVRRDQLGLALAELDRRIAETEATVV
jgi:hypothetical protein